MQWRDHTTLPPRGAFGLLAAFAGCLVAPRLRRRHAQIRDRPAVLRVPDFGIAAEIGNRPAGADNATQLFSASEGAGLGRPMMRVTLALTRSPRRRGRAVSVARQCRAHWR